MANPVTKKDFDISTQWGQALLHASADLKRPEKQVVRLSEPERRALEVAAAKEGVTPEAFLRALFSRWHQDNWQTLMKK